MTMPLGGLAAIADRYDGFILDIWGVLHDGVAAYPGTIATLRALKAAGKRVLLLSNAPRRAGPVAGQVARLGIEPPLYDHLLSSGEAVHRALAERRDPAFATLGRRFALLGPAGDLDLVDGLDYRASRSAEADFILNIGPLNPEATLDDYRILLEEGCRRGLPMICANPDLVVVGHGRNVLCAGSYAARYEELGGSVVRRGKPDPAIYAEALALLGTAPGRTLCVGDGMPTDIRGAAVAGLDAVLVAGGIHAAELGWPPQAAVLEALVQRYGARPMAVMARFVW